MLAYNNLILSSRGLDHFSWLADALEELRIRHEQRISIHFQLQRYHPGFQMVSVFQNSIASFSSSIEIVIF